VSKNFIAGNWKMNGSIDSAISFFQKLIDQTQNANSEILVCLPHVLLHTGLELTANTPIQIGAQDCSKFAGYGAYTGEISANMLKELGCHYAVIGHSERREYFGESNSKAKRC
jgi:triosephosphate isomerase